MTDTDDHDPSTSYSRRPIDRAHIIDFCRSLGLDEHTTEWIRIEPHRITAGGHTDDDHPWLIDMPIMAFIDE